MVRCALWQRWVQGIRGIQNKSLQPVPLWYVNYFQLMAVETLQAQDDLLSPLLNYVEEYELGALLLPIVRLLGITFFLIYL